MKPANPRILKIDGGSARAWNRRAALPRLNQHRPVHGGDIFAG